MQPIHTMIQYHIKITKETPYNEPEKDGADAIEILSIRVDEDPSKAVMRLLAAEKRGPRKSKDSTRKPEGASKA